MSRTCKIHIQINSGTIYDAETHYGFYLMESDDTVTAPVKEYETQEYPEAASAEIYPFTTLTPFDYTCSLLAFGDLITVNSSVQAFFNSLFPIVAGTDVRQALPITIYNEWKGMKVTGYVKSNPAKGYYPTLVEAEKGAYLFDLVLYIADPRTLLPYNA